MLCFQTKLTNVKHSVEKMKNIQGIIRAHMRKDRSIQEDNFIRVNQFSGKKIILHIAANFLITQIGDQSTTCFFAGLYMFVMVSVSLVQVLMIRGLFETPKSKSVQSMRAST